MDFELLSAIILYSAIGLIIFLKRKKFEWIQGFILAYRTKKPLKWMDALHPRNFLWKIYSTICIPLDFYFMPALVYSLFVKAWKIITNADSSAGVALAIPGVRLPGSPFYIPLFYGIISIAILAFVHEMGHGIVSKSEGIKLKSSGFGMFLIFPLFFVEPDEKSLLKASKLSRLRMIGAGAGTNIILALLIMTIAGMTITPFLESTIVGKGVRVTGLIDGFPAANLINEGTIITGINNISTPNITAFSKMINTYKPGENITLNTDKGRIIITTAHNPDNKSLPYLGVYLNNEYDFSKSALEKYGNVFLAFVMVIYKLLSWIALLNFSIGIMNLLPIWGLDGSKMLYEMLNYIMSKKYAKSITSFVSAFCLSLLLINITPFFVHIFS